MQVQRVDDGQFRAHQGANPCKDFAIGIGKLFAYCRSVQSQQQTIQGQGLPELLQQLPRDTFKSARWPSFRRLEGRLQAGAQSRNFLPGIDQ